MILLQDGHELIDHQTSWTPPLLIKMPVLSQETDLSDMCLEFAFVSKIFILTNTNISVKCLLKLNLKLHKELICKYLDIIIPYKNVDI
jgi:hypothetical protein